LALLFAQACVQHFNITIDQNVTQDFYCDSESLLLPIQCTLHRPWVNPSQCLALDFDLKNSILDIIVSLSVSFQCPHVKSHQDDNNEVHLLPWEAQMNVHANALATDYLDNYAAPSKMYHSFQHLKPVSQSTVKPLLDDMQNLSLQQAASTSPRTCKRLMTRNAWSLNAFRFINWDIPEKALETLKNSAQVFIIKFTNDHLSA
jgi:hypothetical protein